MADQRSHAEQARADLQYHAVELAVPKSIGSSTLTINTLLVDIGPMVQKHDQVVRLDIGFEPEAAISGPVLLQTDYDAFLTFNAIRMCPDGRSDTAGTGVIEFEGCSITKFGYPNDEALGGHPLFANGLEFYGVFEVLSSSWIRQIVEQNLVCFPQTRDSNQRHFIFTFHDSTFECVADGYDAVLSTKPYEQILMRITQKMFRRPS